MIYGHDRTIHRTGYIDVRVDKKGRVVAVWYRCLMLPFRQTTIQYDAATTERIEESNAKLPRVLAIEVEDR